MLNLSLPKMIGKGMVFGIRVYQILLSPAFPSCCRFYPSCSEYAITAIRHYGPIKGSLLGIKRLLRCHPWHPGGYDPVK